MHSIRLRDQVGQMGSDGSAVGHQIRKANIQFKFQSKFFNKYLQNRAAAKMECAVFVHIISDINIVYYTVHAVDMYMNAMISFKVLHLLQLKSISLKSRSKVLPVVFGLFNCNLTNLTKGLHAKLGLVVHWPAFPFTFIVCQQAAPDWVSAHMCV